MNINNTSIDFFLPFHRPLGISALSDGSGSFKGWKDIETARQVPEENRMIRWYYSSVFAVLFRHTVSPCPTTRSCGRRLHPRDVTWSGHSPVSWPRQARPRVISEMTSARFHVRICPSVDPVLSFEITTAWQEETHKLCSCLGCISFFRFLAPFPRS